MSEFIDDGSYRTSSIRATENMNFFVTSATHLISLTAKVMFLDRLSASKWLLSVSWLKSSLIWTKPETDPPSLAQSSIDAVAICFSSDTFGCRLSLLVEMHKCVFSALVRFLLGLCLASLSDSGLEGDSWKAFLLFFFLFLWKFSASSPCSLFASHSAVFKGVDKLHTLSFAPCRCSTHSISLLLRSDHVDFCGRLAHHAL